MEIPLSEFPERLRAANTVVVMGNSGSLLDTPSQGTWRLPDSSVTIGVNRMLRRGMDGRLYNPDILFICDSRAVETDYELINRANDSVHLLVAPWVADHPVMDKVYRPFYVYPCHYVDRSKATGEKLQSLISEERPPLKFGERTSTIANVFFNALQVGYAIAYRQLYLLGAEGRWPPSSDKRFAYHHFFHESQIIDTNKRPFRLNQNYNRHWQRIQRFYREHKPDLEVKDLSPWVDLSVMGFPPGDAVQALEAISL